MGVLWFSASEEDKPKSEKDKLKELFPALCRANDPAPRVCGSNTILVGCTSLSCNVTTNNTKQDLYTWTDYLHWVSLNNINPERPFVPFAASLHILETHSFIIEESGPDSTFSNHTISAKLQNCWWFWSFVWFFQKLLDEDDVKVAADAMKELEMFMPSVSGSETKSSKSK